MPRVVESWLRNWIACMAMYYAVGALWAYYIYWCFGNVFFGPGKMPGVEDVCNQIQVLVSGIATASPVLTRLPAAWNIRACSIDLRCAEAPVGLFCWYAKIELAPCARAVCGSILLIDKQLKNRPHCRWQQLPCLSMRRCQP